MRLITVAGPPSSGKTSVIGKTFEALEKQSIELAVIKFDCLSTADEQYYAKKGIKTKLGLSGSLCPDHYFVNNIDTCFHWALKERVDILVTESAGLCNRCSPHIKEILSVCVIDNLSGCHTPKKIGPMLKFADIVVITKGDIVSQAEREVFAYNVKGVNPKAKILHINGITGQGAAELGKIFLVANDYESLDEKKLRFTMPAALCSYCLGETMIGRDYHMGNVKNIKLE